MSRVWTLLSARGLLVASVGVSLSGCLVTVPTSEPTTALSPRRLALAMPAALAPPVYADATVAMAVGRDPASSTMGMPSHAAVMNQIGPPPSPRSAMGGSAGAAVAPSPVVGAPRSPEAVGQRGEAAPLPDVPAETPVVPDAADAAMWAGVRAGQCWAQLVIEPVAERDLQQAGKPQLVWRRALCDDSDAMSAVVVAVQQALRKRGMDVGPEDGKLGQRTMMALMDFQRQQGLAIGLVTFETLDKLGLPKSEP